MPIAIEFKEFIMVGTFVHGSSPGRLGRPRPDPAVSASWRGAASVHLESDVGGGRLPGQAEPPELDRGGCCISVNRVGRARC